MPRRRSAHATTPQARPIRLIQGWRWLMLGVLIQLIWLHMVSVRATFPAALCWLPCMGIAAGLWFLWLNRHRRGLWIMAVGAGLNGLVMVTNGGLMPLVPGALPRLGAEHRLTAQAVTQSKDRLVSDDRAHLAALGDRLAGEVGRVRIAASLGDAVVLGGIVITLAEEVMMGVSAWRMLPNPGRNG